MSGPPEFPGFVWSRGFWSFFFKSFESFSFFFQKKHPLSLSFSFLLSSFFFFLPGLIAASDCRTFSRGLPVIPLAISRPTPL